MLDQIKDLYETLKTNSSSNLKSPAVFRTLSNISKTCLDFLESECSHSSLNSPSITDKEYFVFRQGETGDSSRPVNRDLYSEKMIHEEVDALSHTPICSITDTLRDNEIDQLLYTIAMSYCCAIDLLKSGDRKTPATFFEKLIGHIFARAYDTNPEDQLAVLNLELEKFIPTDFVLKLAEGKSHIHLPVKTSTRERIIQVWAHQRILDGVYGTNRFKGILVSIAETNKRGSESVHEVCVPNQWQLYQMFIAHMHRIYYLDVPHDYLKLSENYPFINVKRFSQFFHEAKDIVKGAAR